MNDSQLIQESNNLLKWFIGLVALTLIMGVVMTNSRPRVDENLYTTMAKMMSDNRTQRRTFAIDCTSKQLSYQSRSRDSIEATMRSCINAADEKFPELNWLELARKKEKSNE